jgi:hypothetical protein
VLGSRPENMRVRRSDSLCGRSVDAQLLSATKVTAEGGPAHHLCDKHAYDERVRRITNRANQMTH